MKLFSYRDATSIRCGVEAEGITYDTSALFPRYDSNFLGRGGLEALAEALARQDAGLRQLDDTPSTLVAPFALPSKIVCVGLNYADHARETGANIPEEPILFMKSTTSFSGPFDPVMIPRDSLKTDWEVELAVVIGRKTRYVSPTDANSCIAGYCVHNDLSERAFQLERGGTWDKGKGCDTFAPMGPYLVTPEEVGDVHQKAIWLSLNGKRMQNSRTDNLLFKVPELISYISRFMTLLPGDIISTGTPPGVGLGLQPPLYLKAGDIMELGIEGLGTQRQEVIAFSADYAVPEY